MRHRDPGPPETRRDQRTATPRDATNPPLDGVDVSEVAAGIWLASGRVAPGLAQALFLVVAARLSSASVLGVLAVGAVTAQWLGMLNDFGSGDMLLLRVGEGHRLVDFARPMGRSKVLLGGITILGACAAGAVVGPTYGPVVAAGGLYATALGSTPPLTARFILIGRASRETAIAWVEGVATVAVGAALIGAERSPWVVIVAFAVVRFAGNFLRLRTGGGSLAAPSAGGAETLSPDLPTQRGPFDARSVLRQGLPFVAFVACLVTFFQADVVVLAALASPALVGLYQVAWRLVYFPGTLGESLILVLLPRLAGDTTQASGSPTARAAALLPLFAPLGVVIGAALWLSGPWLVTALFGADFIGAVDLVRILALGVPIRFVSYAAEVVITASGRLGARLVAAGSYTVLGVIAMVVGGVLGGASGVAWARVVAEVVVLLSYAVTLRRIGREDPHATTTAA